ncbi:hypothetical protein [Streptomyces sp. NPDC057740]
MHNWSWDPVTVTVPGAVRDVLTRAVYATEVPLGPWDVKAVQQQ